MKHFFFLVLIVISSILLLRFNTTYAAPLKIPIGGRIISNAVPGIVCNSAYGGPFTIYPVTKSSPVFYVVSTTAKVYLNYILAPGSWFKGFYSPIVNLTLCHTPSEPPVPFPVFPITMFGSSK